MSKPLDPTSKAGRRRALRAIKEQAYNKLTWGYMDAETGHVKKRVMARAKMYECGVWLGVLYLSQEWVQRCRGSSQYIWGEPFIELVQYKWERDLAKGRDAQTGRWIHVKHMNLQNPMGGAYGSLWIAQALEWFSSSGVGLTLYKNWRQQTDTKTDTALEISRRAPRRKRQRTADKPPSREDVALCAQPEQAYRREMWRWRKQVTMLRDAECVLKAAQEAHRHAGAPVLSMEDMARSMHAGLTSERFQAALRCLIDYGALALAPSVYFKASTTPEAWRTAHRLDAIPEELV